MSAGRVDVKKSYADGGGERRAADSGNGNAARARQ